MSAARGRRRGRRGATLVGALVAGLSGCGGDAAPAAIDAPALDAGPGWATYRIDVGRHDAEILDGTSAHPVRGLVMVGARDYAFRFDATARYTITAPVEPGDQLDWNKLPGLSDCDTVDLSVDGAMFGWRWRLDVEPPHLEVTAYANNAGVHLTPAEPLLTLSADELAAATPLRYRLALDGAVYRFAIDGAIAGRPIAAATTLPRACPATPVDSFKWAAGLYFGGTSTAPSVITGGILERLGP